MIKWLFSKMSPVNVSGIDAKTEPLKVYINSNPEGVKLCLESLITNEEVTKHAKKLKEQRKGEQHD